MTNTERSSGLSAARRHSVIWDSPSAGPFGSMPLGNGDISLNAWVEASGDLCFYIGKTDSWDENGRLLKLGLIRVSLEPSPFAPGGPFRQELRIASGDMIVTGAVTIRLWVDANHPVVEIEIDAAAPLTATARFHPWRTERTELPSVEVSDIQFDWSPGHMRGPTFVDPDTILAGLTGEVGWYHRNLSSVGPEQTMRHQGLMHEGWIDPLLHRIFGALVRGDGYARIDDRTLVSAGRTRHRFRVFALTMYPATVAEWLAGMRRLVAEVEAVPAEERRSVHESWWSGFWSRSFVDIRPTGGDSGDGREDVARGYALQRFVNACAGRGAHPIKFNGSILTVPHPGTPGDADYRRWGPGYWWQNTRLPYLSMCASGDFDLMQPFFRSYVDEMLPFNKHRAKRHFGFEDAAYYPECVYFWGPVFTETYGEQPAAERADKLQESGWHKWEWVGGLELAWLMQDYYEHIGDEAFLAQRLIPTALAVLRFFDRFYRTGEDGKLLMHPSQALETFWECTNPMPEVAGMRAVTDRLLSLPQGKIDERERSWLQAFERTIPDMPTREENGERMLAAAERFADKRNVENPELYAVYPFRLVSFEKPNAELGIRALRHRTDRGAFGWRQDDLFMACLGLTEEAKEHLVQRARAWDPKMRFPAFWGPNYDWTPDQDHGGVLMKTLQAMLMQTEGRKILLLPAWPKEWDVDFRLHAPYGTVVEGSIG